MQAAAAAAAAANAVPSTVSVGCHLHKLKSANGSNGWACDGKGFPGGCKSGCTGFDQLHGALRWQCAACDYDLCEKCVRNHMIVSPLPSTVFTSIHAHTLNKSSRPINGWGCDGRSASGGCRSGTTGFRQLSGWNRYTCANGCDYDLCEKCVRAHLTAAPTGSGGGGGGGVAPRCVNGHDMRRKVTNSSHWSCEVCARRSRTSNEAWAKVRYTLCSMLHAPCFMLHAPCFMLHAHAVCMAYYHN